MVLLSHPMGNQFVRHTLEALLDAELLGEFHTGMNWNPESMLNNFLPGKLRAELNRRAYPAAIRERTRVHRLKEVGRLAAQALGVRGLTTHETGCFSVDAVFQNLDRRVARRLKKSPEFRCVYAYEDGALESFLTAKERGVRCAYDLPIAYWETSRRLLAEEAERLPQWEPTLVGTRDSEAKLERKTREMELADLVVCPSRFVFESIPERLRAGRECVVAEFGSPSVSQAGSETRDRNGPLRVLFAGSMTQRKGLADVFSAFQIVRRSDVELVVFGSLVQPLEFYRNVFPHFRHEAPRPHAEVLDLMRTCDVLVLPSIVEGRALVQQEALSCGLPLIVTTNAGGSDLVEEGRTGFLVTIRSPEKIAEKIAWFADHRTELESMRVHARAKAAACTWQRYGELIVGAVRKLVAGDSRVGELVGRSAR